MKHALALITACLLATIAIVGFDSTATASTQRCPLGHSQMGCSLAPILKGTSTPPKGEIIPDVSAYQGNVNWFAVKAWQLAHGWKTSGGIFKLGEIALDPYAVRNAHQLHAFGMVAIGYVFVRPGLKAATVINWARTASIKTVVLDEEITGIQGTAARIVPALKHAGLTIIDYHSQRNVLDSTAQGLPCWVADYGPHTPPVCTTGKTVAWQFTSLGHVPGINSIVDESISYGLLKLAIPPRTICFGKHATPKSAKCKPIIKHYDTLLSQAAKLRKQYS